MSGMLPRVSTVGFNPGTEVERREAGHIYQRTVTSRTRAIEANTRNVTNILNTGRDDDVMAAVDLRPVVGAILF